MDQAWMTKLSPHAKKVLDDLEHAEFTETVPPMSDADCAVWEEIRLAWKAHVDGPDAESPEKVLRRREVEEWRTRAHEKLRALSEGERRRVLASVEGTLAVEGMTLDAEDREALLAYARGELSAEDFDIRLLRRVWLAQAARDR